MNDWKCISRSSASLVLSETNSVVELVGGLKYFCVDSLTVTHIFFKGCHTTLQFVKHVMHKTYSCHPSLRT